MKSRQKRKRTKWTRARLSLESLECRALLATVPGLLPPDVPEIDTGDTIAIEDSPLQVNQGQRIRTAADGGQRGDGPRPSDAPPEAGRPERTGQAPNQGPPESPGERTAPSLDGTGNNLENEQWGSTGTQLLRLTSVQYADGISEPTGDDRPGAREVSNAAVAQSESIANDRDLTSFVWIWGQFLDHDITLTHSSDLAGSSPIEVPAGDPFFDPLETGTVTIGMDRSQYDPSTGDSLDDPRQQVNSITAFIDGSAVYGSDQERADALRTFEGGKLATSDGDLLPFNEAGLENAGVLAGPRAIHRRLATAATENSAVSRQTLG